MCIRDSYYYYYYCYYCYYYYYYYYYYHYYYCCYYYYHYFKLEWIYAQNGSAVLKALTYPMERNLQFPGFLSGGKSRVVSPSDLNTAINNANIFFFPT